MFGLKLADRMDGTYYSILILVLLTFSALILTVTNLNYQRLNSEAEKIIKNRYKKFVSQFIYEQTSTEQSKKRAIAGTEIRRAAARLAGRRVEREKINTRKINKSIIAKYKKFLPHADGLTNKYARLPDTEDYVDNLGSASPEQLSYNTASWPANAAHSSQEVARSDGINNYDAGTLEDPLKHPFNYIIKRHGEVYINLTDEMVNNDGGPNGYRNPEEIERVVSEHQPMIEHCFRKAAELNPGLKGFVKVAFSISPNGFVLPESIRIISSSLRSKKFERCIKEYIRRWKSFEKLDESMGIARVVQKFIFN